MTVQSTINETKLADSTVTFEIENIGGVFNINETSRGAYMIETQTNGNKVIHEIQFVDSESGELIQLYPIGRIESDSDTTIIALYLMESDKYGVLINLDGTIDVFAYDPDESGLLPDD